MRKETTIVLQHLKKMPLVFNLETIRDPVIELPAREAVTSKLKTLTVENAYYLKSLGFKINENVVNVGCAQRCAKR